VRIDVGSEPPSVPRSQTEFEEFFDLALDLMVIAGFDGSIRRVNAAYERTLGHPVRELLSRPFLETVHPEDVPRVRDLFGELVDGDRGDVIGFENRVAAACLSATGRPDMSRRSCSTWSGNTSLRSRTSRPMPLDSETTFDRCSGRDARSELMADQLGEDVAVSERELRIGQAIAVECVVREPDG
jgi:PAS domain S-box-containing protein